MSTNKYINIFITIMMTFAVLFCLVLVFFSANGETEVVSASVSEFGYKNLLDQYHVMEVDICIDEREFADILENPTEEEYKQCEITVDGKTYTNVAIRTKGNTSLSQVASTDSDRYSFKVEFDHYVKGQTLEGLDKLVLNNIFCDATYVKEYMAYDIFQYLGVACPCYSFAHITINGEEWGLYLALEALEDSFVERVYGTKEGELYKPESVQNRGGQMDEMPSMGGEIPEIDEAPSWMNDEAPQKKEDMQHAEGREMPEGGMPLDREMPEDGMLQDHEMPPKERMQPGGGRLQIDGFTQSDGGSSLSYIDDEIDSYQDIFENAVFSPTDEDKERVIEALENLSEGRELERYLDVDACIRYFAAQTFIVNMDSYYSELKHNYYLYEENGQLTILPWDLNLAFGGFQASDATEAVNGAIDTPMNGREEERPLFSKIMEVEEYKELYHQYLKEIVDGYTGSGRFARTLHTITALIDDDVKKDATAFYSYEEYLTAIANLEEFVLLRAESVEAQLNGLISPVNSERKNTSALIDASMVDLKAMGVQGNSMH